MRSRPLAVIITQYTICGLPLDHELALHFSVLLEWRPGGRYVVRRLSQYLDVDGEWLTGPDDTEQWRADNWHSYDTAADLARVAAAELTFKGQTAAQILDAERPPKTPCPEGFHWMGQSFAHCDMCGLPAWEHDGMAEPKRTGTVSDVFSSNGHWVLKPWTPEGREACRRRWDSNYRTESKATNEP